MLYLLKFSLLVVPRLPSLEMNKCVRTEIDSERKRSPSKARGSTSVAIWGDPVVGRALVLLLRGSGYDARFLPVSSLRELGTLEGVGLLLLAPATELSSEQREALLSSLRDMEEAAKIPVLELDRSSQEAPEGRAREGPLHTVPWPCRIEELEQRIDAALSTKPAAGPATGRESSA